MALETTEQMLIEQRITNDSKNAVIAYLLWFFLWPFGAHRFYLARIGSAIVMLILSITVVGLIVTFIWAIVDLFLIPGMIKEDREKLRQQLTMEALARGAPKSSPPPAGPATTPDNPA
jgi:TM2 domain-containing membrane protein YozV